jgi:hypothetical protein
MSNSRQTPKDALHHFGNASVRLAELLKEGASFTSEEHLFIENNLLIVQLALALSKHTSKRPPSFRHE